MNGPYFNGNFGELEYKAPSSVWALRWQFSLDDVRINMSIIPTSILDAAVPYHDGIYKKAWSLRLTCPINDYRHSEQGPCVRYGPAIFAPAQIW